MTLRLTLYTRRDCCLCEEMTKTIRKVEADISLEVEEIDVDTSPELRELYGNEVPVLFINGRKAFKYRLTTGALRVRLTREQSH
jgi:glutaredoxin